MPGACRRARSSIEPDASVPITRCSALRRCRESEQAASTSEFEHEALTLEHGFEQRQDTRGTRVGVETEMMHKCEIVAVAGNVSRTHGFSLSCGV